MIRILLAFALITASPALALECRGTLLAPPITYDLTVTVAGGQYRVEAVDRASGEVTLDEGACADGLRGCRHEFVSESGAVEEYYDFTLEPQPGGGYRYRETWGDGSAAEAAMDCH